MPCAGKFTEQTVSSAVLGVFDFPFIVSYRNAMLAEGAAAYGKLLDLRRTDIVLSPHDLDRISDDPRFNRLTTGSIAIMIGRPPPPMLIDMAMLLQHRMGNSRRICIFVYEEEARRWLAG